ncbi:MAG TPA: metallophosphoesterase, partial [Humisphaera sp.]|nr:metallophosphoesterase [Humisphaera sp.]
LLVITGDFIDKYDRSLDVITALRRLQTQAKAAGGNVIITMGNHEAEFLAGGATKKKAVSVTAKLLETDAKGKKTPTLKAELIAKGISAADVIAGTDKEGIGQFLRDLPIAAKVNDWFFCHAGNTHGSTLSDLRQQLMSGIDADGFGSAILADPDSILEARMHPDVWWEKDAADKHDKTGEALRANLMALGCRHLVFGHQPGEVDFADGSKRKRDEMFTKFNGLFFMIDTGMSRGADSGRGAVLWIHRDLAESPYFGATACYADGKSQLIWRDNKRR